MVNTVLFPSSYFDTAQVDEDLQREYTAVISCGLYDEPILFSYEDWFHKNRLRLSGTPEKMISAVYRGWMMKPEQYAQFYHQLLEKNIQLTTTPEAYSLFHLFPNIYPHIKADTPKILIFPNGTPIKTEQLRSHFERFMVKDYVKSVKGTDFPVYFDSAISQAEFDKWMDIFYAYRGNLLTDGICIKEYVNLKKYGSKTNEYRVFYANHIVAAVSRNSGQIDCLPEPPAQLIETYRKLGSPFYTVDYAELEDGSWKILEAGDGSVSGLSDFQDYTQFFRTLYHCFL